MTLAIDTELLRTFVTIVETRSFTRSGDRLHRTQPAISMQMRRLEDTMGKDLFDRSRREIRLTKEGEILLHYARRILALGEEARSRIARSGLEGIVRIGTSDDYATLLLPDILRSFSHSHARVQVEVICGNGVDIERKLRDGLVDIALVARRGDVPAHQLLRVERLVWIAAADFPLSGASPIPLAVFPDGCVCRGAMADALAAVDLDWRIAFSSDNIGAIHATVRSGMAITAVEESLVPSDVRRLGRAEGFPELAPVSLALMITPANTAPALDALADEIRAGLSEGLGLPRRERPIALPEHGYA